MTKGSIELSPKHGVNPTIPVCFWCGEEKNEIVLLGHVRERDPITGRAVCGSDVEAPMKMVLNYEPCQKCQDMMSKGVTIVGVASHTKDSRPPIGKDPNGVEVYPTGSFLVVRKEALCVEADNGSMCLMPEKELQKILPEQNKAS